VALNSRRDDLLQVVRHGKLKHENARVGEVVRIEVCRGVKNYRDESEEEQRRTTAVIARDCFQVPTNVRDDIGKAWTCPSCRGRDGRGCRDRSGISSW
jgi:hypothetical protein